MIWPAGAPGGRFNAADGHHPVATIGKTAAGQDLIQRGNPPGDDRQPAQALLRCREAVPQHAAVGMAGLGEEVGAGGGLDNLTGVHNGQAVRRLRHHPEVVGDEQHRQAGLAL